MTARHRPAPGRPTVTELANECGYIASIDGALFVCCRRPDHLSWHHLCRPGTREPVYFRLNNIPVPVRRVAS